MRNKTIPNPNKISILEKEFIENTSSLHAKTSEHIPTPKKEVYEKFLITAPHTFYNELNAYLKHNPTEGKRSSFIVRIVANYIKTNSNI